MKRGLLVSNITCATLFRIIEQWNPSLLLDEAHVYMKEDKDLRGIFCGAYTRGSAKVPRCNQETYEVEFFSTFGPKAVAQIGALDDQIASRCFPIKLARKSQGGDVRPFREREDSPMLIDIGRRAERWAKDNADKLQLVRINLPNDRISDIWEPMLGIAKLAGGEWYDRAVQAAIAMGDNTSDSETFEGRLITGLWRFAETFEGVLSSGGILLPTKSILTELNRDEEAPWANWKNMLTAEKLASTLRRYDVNSIKCRAGDKALIGDKPLVRGYLLMDLKRVFDRYMDLTPKNEPQPGTEPVDQVPEPLRGVPSSKNNPEQRGSVFQVENITRNTADQVPEPLREECSRLDPVLEGKGKAGDKTSVPPFIYITDEDQLSAVLQDFTQPGAVALDIETYYPDAKLTKEGKRMKVAGKTVMDRYQSKIRLLQLYRDGSETVWLLDLMALDSDSAPFQTLRTMLAGKDIVGHNITCFDMPWVWEHLRISASHIKDTQTAHRLLFGGLPPDEAKADLGSVFKRTFQLDLPKDKGSSDWGTETLTEEQLVYAAHDVRHLHDVLRAQEAELAKDKLRTAWNLEQRLAPIVVQMTNTGFGFNTDGVKEATATLEARLADAELRTLDWFGNPALNLDSPKKLLAAFQSKGRHLSSTGEEALKADGSEGALLLLEYRNIRDKELKFLTGLSAATQADGRIHATFNPGGAKTGRFSCKDPNLQNIPKLGKDLFPIRSLFQAPPGRKLVIADFAQMELVAAAVLAPEPKMLEAFKSGEDLHCRTASILLGRTVTKSDKADRSLAKAVNFGLLYGSSAAGLKTYAKNSYGVDLTDEEAVQFHEAFFNEYQGLAAWHERARAAANDPEVTEVRTHRIGRRQHLADTEHWWQRFTNLLNTRIQGTCAEVTKLCLLDIGTKLKDRAQLVSCIHDEIIVECDEDQAAAVMAPGSPHGWR